MTEQNTQQPSEQEELEQELRAIGNRLALLLQVADIPEDQKEAWAALVPEMTPEQIDQLTEYLSRKIPDKEKADADKLLKKLTEIQDAHEEKQSEQEGKVHAALDQIEEELKNV